MSYLGGLSQELCRIIVFFCATTMLALLNELCSKEGYIAQPWYLLKIYLH